MQSCPLPAAQRGAIHRIPQSSAAGARCPPPVPQPARDTGTVQQRLSTPVSTAARGAVLLLMMMRMLLII